MAADLDDVVYLLERLKKDSAGEMILDQLKKIASRLDNIESNLGNIEMEIKNLQR